MEDNKVTKISVKSALIKAIMANNLRVFSKEDLKPFADELEIESNYMSRVLSHLVEDGFIEKIQKGLYVITSIMDFSPVLEQEIAMKIVNPSVISHYTAFRFHELTEQIPRHIFLTTIKKKSTPQKGGGLKKAGFKFHGVEYYIVQTSHDKFFGEMEVSGYEGSYQVTDLERTLLDGLARPELCGGFGEVMYAIEEASSKIDLNKIIAYALRLDIAISRRLGWALNEIGIHSPKLAPLSQKQSPGYRKLVSCNEARGVYEPRWRLQIND